MTVINITLEDTQGFRQLSHKKNVFSKVQVHRVVVENLENLRSGPSVFEYQGSPHPLLLICVFILHLSHQTRILLSVSQLQRLSGDPCAL